MSLLTHLRTMFDYDFWATARFFDCLSGMDSAPPEALRQLAHYLAARRAWLTRLEHGESFEVELWPEVAEGNSGLTQLRELAASTESDLRRLLDGLDERALLRSVSYLSYERTQEQRLLKDILAHLVNHSSYHRGCITFAIRQAGGMPVGTDFIEYALGFA